MLKRLFLNYFFPIRKFPKANDRDSYISVDVFYDFSSLVLEPYELKRSTSVAERSQHFTVEIALCKHKLYVDSCSSFTSHLQDSNPACTFPYKLDVEKIKRNVNRYILPSRLLFFYCPLSLIYIFSFSHILSCSVTVCILVALLSCLG